MFLIHLKNIMHMIDPPKIIVIICFTIIVAFIEVHIQ